jgi:hypothetical protein
MLNRNGSRGDLYVLASMPPTGQEDKKADKDGDRSRL